MGYLEAAFPSVRVSVLPGCLFGSRRPVFLASFEPSGLGISGSTKRERKKPSVLSPISAHSRTVRCGREFYVYFFSYSPCLCASSFLPLVAWRASGFAGGEGAGVRLRVARVRKAPGKRRISGAGSVAGGGATRTGSVARAE